MGRDLVLAALIAAAALAALGGVMELGFVALDDETYVTGNAAVQAGLTPEGLRWAFREEHASNWHPLTWLSHMADVELFGLEPRGHHAVNLALHVAAALLLFAALVRATGARAASFAVALLFAVHPQRVESVAWVSERKDVLAGLFFGATLWAWVGWARRGTAWRYVLAAGLLALGLLAKPMLVTLPCVLLLLDWWPLGRVRGGPPAAREGGGREPRPWSALVIEKLPLLALALVSSATTFLVQRHGGAVTPTDSIPLVARLSNAAVSYARYVGKAFWPTDLAAFYPHPGQIADGWGAPIVAACVAGLVAVTAVLARGRLSAPWLWVGWLWFLGMLVPVIGVLQVGSQAMADRYAYLPQIGLLIGLVFGVRRLVEARPALRSAAGAALALAAVACALLTRIQVRTWRDTESLARHALAVTEDNWMGHVMLGSVHREAGSGPQAVEHYQRALEIHPRCALARLYLALVHEQEGRADEAIAEYRELLSLFPDYALGQRNLGLAIARSGRPREALPHLRRAIQLDPGGAPAHDDLGIALFQLGEADQAIQQWERAVGLDPDLAAAQFHLGWALYGRGERERARHHLELALRDPDLPQADQARAMLDGLSKNPEPR